MNQHTNLDKLSISIPSGIYALFEKNDVGILLQDNGPVNSCFEWMAGFGVEKEFIGKEDEPVFDQLPQFLGESKNIFGHFSYDLKNTVEALSSRHFSGMEFPPAYFFIPQLTAIKTKGDPHIETNNADLNSKLQNDFFTVEKNVSTETTFPLKERTTKEKYISTVQAILTHIHRGDIYEINYCIEFYAEKVTIDPIAVYRKLNELCEAPFSVLYKYHDQWLLCASPERFLKKTDSQLISQPIKGTRPRGKNAKEDERLKTELFNDPKERSENVMIVDLVRNDLSRSAKKGSVKVEELYGIHSFKNVHQMVSTVTAQLEESVHPVEAIKNAFPMGSMTGAPKIRAMQLSEEFENMKRGLYSGAVGYFTPEMDFDFNVVIRSIQYNAKTGYLSLMVGSAITAKSDPEKEYAECLVKAETLFRSLGVSH